MTHCASADGLYESIMKVVQLWATSRSKDPNTKVGAGIYDPTTGALFLGYNGFASGIEDTATRWQRPTKYEYVIHAEENAIFKALAAIGHRMNECTLFLTHKPCHRCMSRIVQTGIKTVYYVHKHDNSTLTSDIAREAGVALLWWSDYMTDGYPF